MGMFPRSDRVIEYAETLVSKQASLRPWMRYLYYIFLKMTLIMPRNSLSNIN